MKGIKILIGVAFTLIGVTVIVILLYINQVFLKEAKPKLSGPEKLARQYCSTCHLFPDPDLLDRNTWQHNVLPNMGRRLGMDHHSIFDYPEIPPLIAVSQPLLTQLEWENIVAYFVRNAPRKLIEKIPKIKPVLDSLLFRSSSFNSTYIPSLITLLKSDNNVIYVGEGVKSKMYQLDYNGITYDSVEFENPATDIAVDKDFLDVTLVGILHPNDLTEGSIVRIRKQPSGWLREVVVDQLARPVASLKGDFNNNSRPDYLVCEYGNIIGSFSMYETQDNDDVKRTILDNNPGATQVFYRDMNNDGLKDIIALMAQGDERIIILYVNKNGKFTHTTALRFPSVYGSLGLDISDMNGDGYLDIIYTNGDNWDLSPIVKPYHGVRIFENDRKEDFKEMYFYPLKGTHKVKIADFDLDGDKDLVITANPRVESEIPNWGVLILQNQGNYTFKPYAYKDAIDKQWALVELVDIDKDGDEDILVGAMNFRTVLFSQGKIPENIEKKDYAVLILENLTIP